MIIDNIKISQEINFNGMPTWISIGGTLVAGENEKDGLRQIQKSITEYQQEEAKAYKQSKNSVSVEAQAAADKEIDKLFKQVKTKLSKYSNREEAQAYLDTTEFKFNIELKQIVNNLNPKN